LLSPQPGPSPTYIHPTRRITNPPPDRAQVRFAEGAAPGISFTFYYDPDEPVNGDPRRANINPEVVCCTFE
jgi:hypothetical protein